MLIHAAAGGSGSAAIQLAVARRRPRDRHRGSDEKVQLCRELGADVAVNYTTTTSPRSCWTQTGGKGVDVVFDNVGEAVMDDSMNCTAYNGRYLMMGFASNKAVADEKFDRPPPHRPGQHQALRRAARRTPTPSSGPPSSRRWAGTSRPTSSGPRSWSRSSTWSGRNGCGPWSGRVVDFDDVPAAFEAMANRETVGRTIVRLWPD